MPGDQGLVLGVGEIDWKRHAGDPCCQGLLPSGHPVTCCSFELVKKARALMRRRHFGRMRGICSGLPQPQVILGSKLDEFSCPQARTRIRTEAVAESSCSWTELPRRELFF